MGFKSKEVEVKIDNKSFEGYVSYDHEEQELVVRIPVDYDCQDIVR